MDASSLAERYKCGVCGFLPEEPFAADDGHFYHESCITAIFQSAGDGVITSPVTKMPMGRRIILYATTIRCVIEKILESDGVEQSVVRPDFLDATSVVRETKELAHKGCPEHMAQLGRWYLLGEQEGVDCDEKEGYAWCLKAAEKGDPNGMAYQGLCLIHGYGVDADRIDGFELLVYAANKGSAYAAYKLGSFYLYGMSGFKEDRKRAEKWLGKADDNKDKLTEFERENVSRYLKSILGGPREQTLETVPENIDVSSNTTTSATSGHAAENDHDSISALTAGTGSAAGSSGSGAGTSSLSSRSPASDERAALSSRREAASATSSSLSHHSLGSGSSTTVHSNKSPESCRDSTYT